VTNCSSLPASIRYVLSWYSTSVAAERIDRHGAEEGPTRLGALAERAEIERLKAAIQGVPGWLADEEAEALYDLARACTGSGVIVEIGSWYGKSTICLGLGSRAGNGVRIFAVDPHGDHRFGDFQANLERVGIQDLVTPIRSLSQPAADDFQHPIELLWVDGSHEYDLVKEDFQKWVPKIVEGGVVALHDTTWTAGPRKVVAEEIFGSRGFKDVRFVLGSTTIARKVAENRAVDHVRARYVQGVKGVFTVTTVIVKKGRRVIPSSVERAGRRALRHLVG
jgi:MMP 1-O-methyltransferase